LHLNKRIRIRQDDHPNYLSSRIRASKETIRTEHAFPTAHRAAIWQLGMGRWIDLQDVVVVSLADVQRWTEFET